MSRLQKMVIEPQDHPFDTKWDVKLLDHDYQGDLGDGICHYHMCFYKVFINNGQQSVNRTLTELKAAVNKYLNDSKRGLKEICL